ncbi:MAG: phosphoenolpyruvate carboxykinase (ATP) [Bacteroidota bacterium]
MTMLTTSFVVQQNIECQKIHWNYTPEKLIEHSLKSGQGVLSDQGALCIRTGTFTGRSPKDKFIVMDEMTKNTVDWNDINQPISSMQFEGLKKRMLAHAETLELYGQDVYACADERYRLNVRVLAQFPWSCQFAHNMFKNPTKDELVSFRPDWTILCLPMFKADPELDGTRQSNFTIVNFSEKLVLIGGSGYTGEIKKSIFSVLNYTLPLDHKVLPMHCSANVGEAGDTAIFFGLSGTGKTTLSTDPNRQLIGDDEHGWSDAGVFNFEGGCYAKCINLSEEKEPEIYRAIRHGAILENIIFKNGHRVPDFDNSDITQNTRVSYPINHIDNIMPLSKGGHPKNIFFLTCDAFGVLPPISKLTKEQAKKYFLLGYTAKIAGTETGINEPQMTFSACFGAPFLPLAPEHYADMLVEKMEAHDTNVWLVNTGWIGGAYGEGERIALKYTRTLIQAVLNGQLTTLPLRKEAFFDLHIPVLCTGVPHRILDPQNTWADKAAYVETANRLKAAFDNKVQENVGLATV